MSAAENARGKIDCPRCGGDVGGEQDWCLHCGTAARTRIVRAPNWRVPVAILATLAALSLAALAVAFLDMTRDEPRAPLVPVPTATTIQAPATTP